MIIKCKISVNNVHKRIVFIPLFLLFIQKRKEVFMAILLFVLWILLNGRFTLDAGMAEIVVSGIAVAALVYIFAVKALGFSPKAELYFWRNAVLLIAYCAVLVWEVLKANYSVVVVILNKERKVTPAVVKVNIPLKKSFSRMLLANSITLTPGTITIDQNGDEYTVHCLDRSFIDGIENSRFVKILERMEK